MQHLSELALLVGQPDDDEPLVLDQQARDALAGVLRRRPVRALRWMAPWAPWAPWAPRAPRAPATSWAGTPKSTTEMTAVWWWRRGVGRGGAGSGCRG